MKKLSVAAVLLQFVLFSFYNQIVGDDGRIVRKSLEIELGPIGGIVIGGGSPTPPPPENYSCPSPPSEPVFPFESKRVKIVYPVIQAFKRKITSDPFNITQTWVGPDICHNYKGFFCATAPDTNQTAVAGVDFNGYKFAGPELTLSGFLDKLPDIAIFHANSNYFTGSVPKTISNLRYLYELDMSNNLFSGEFPNQIFGATNLTFLDLRFNKFSGLLPSQVFYLELDIFFINDNNFMQNLPDNLGSSQIYYLSLANNNFVGPIPRSIGDLKDTLLEVLFLNNHLSGCLPSEIGLLKNLTLFDASRNNLTGPLPLSFGCLSRIEIINLAQNNFFGPVPECLCSLPKLGNLSLSYNYFTSVGPACKKLIWKKVLDVRMNCILGLPDQRSAADCQAFFCKPKLKCCTDEKSMNWNPCGGRLNGNEQQAFDTMARPPMSYSALIPQPKP